MNLDSSSKSNNEGNSGYKVDNSLLMLHPDFINAAKEEKNQGLNKLFEDPDERMLRIKTSIEKSQIKKR